MAYHSVNHNPDKILKGSSQPATRYDLLTTLQMSRGISVSTGAKPKAALGPTAPPMNVHGGASTPAHQAVMSNWHKANLPRDLQRKTGADATAVSWLLDHD